MTGPGASASASFRSIWSSRAIPEGLQRLAVYGAGAGRLAADIHQHLRARRRRFALDVNPLPFLIADRLLAGETL